MSKESVHINYLSYTGFTKADACMESWYREYHLRQRPPFEDQRNVLRGNTLHNLMEAYLLAKVDDPQWLIDNLPAFWKAEVVKAATIKWRGPNDEAELFAKVQGWALSLARLFKKYNLQPENMQSEFKADTHVEIGGHKLKMAGRVDIVMRTQDEKLLFLDLKGSENKEVMKLDQIVWYSILLEKFSGEEAPYGGYLLPGFAKNKQFPLFHIPEQAKRNLERRIVHVIERAAAGDFAPTPQDQMCFWCPVKYACSIFGGALEHRSGIVQLGGDGGDPLDTLL